MSILSVLKSHRWDLGLMECKTPDMLLTGEWVWNTVKNPYKDRWFADPQILDADSSHIKLLAEEYEYKRAVGRIAKLTIDLHTLTISDVKIILDLPTHLSFPSIIRKGREVFVHPENSASGTHFCYKYDGVSLVEPVLMADAPLTDAVAVNFCGDELMLSTEISDNKGNGVKVGVYRKDEKSSVYKLWDTIVLRDNTARSAGDFFFVGDRCMRPAQICNTKYGEGICIQELTKLGERFELNDILRVYAPSPYDAMHTLNVGYGWAVADFRCYNYPFTHAVLSRIKHFRAVKKYKI